MKFIKNKINTLSMAVQLMIMLVLSMTIVLFLVVGYSYTRNIKTINKLETSSQQALLSLEGKNLNSYVSQLDQYSLLLRSDESFMKLISSNEPLAQSNISYIQNLLRVNFYSRNDLSRYDLYLVNQKTQFTISKPNRNIVMQPFLTLDKLIGFETFTASPYFRSINSAYGNNNFLVYYRTIIDIQTKNPLAIVKLTINNAYPDELARTQTDNKEIFCIGDKDGKLLYSSNSEIVGKVGNNQNLLQKNKKKSGNIVTLNGHKYLLVSNDISENGWSVYSLSSQEITDTLANSTRNISIIIGIIAIAIATFLAIIVVKLLTGPLSKLAHRLRQVGKGNFKTTIDIHGCSEIDTLTEDFNLMISQIADLIEKNYVSDLREKTARLLALEAEINPHFLYNTLQTISAEAVENDQMHIHEMIVSLSNMFRYSIKGGDLVSVQEELKHVENYLFLQKSRFEDLIEYSINSPYDCMDIQVPKLSFITMIENSIIYGMEGSGQKIQITITVQRCEDYILLRVEDNGIGIPPDKLEGIQKSIESLDILDTSSPNRSIGLYNIASRLQILYNKRATLEIDSVYGQYTCVSIKIFPQDNQYLEENGDV
jgi:Predicted signal transduction protein with a C-terminal ATPase domain